MLAPATRFALAVFALLGLGASEGRAASAWSTVKAPAAGAPQSIGAPSAGCIAGARPLPLDGRGYQVVGAGRRRYFGHPELVAYVESLGRAVSAAGFADLYVGDLGQPRGGPMPGGHASHQTGLDVDVLFDLAPKPRRTTQALDSIETPSLVAADNVRVDPSRWQAEHLRLLALAAASANVERIFVHPAIKKLLCVSVAGERAWLQKLRPWYGHDAHFHVRLRCPAGNEQCVAGPELPPGDGCDESLAWWFQEEDGRLHAFREVDPRPPSRGEHPRPDLPDACAAVLHAR